MTATMPLLSSNESYRLHAALLEYSDTIGPEWTLYTTAADDLISQRQGSERLAKATKDLMSLDTNSLRWNESADRAVLHDPIPLQSQPGSATDTHSSSTLTHQSFSASYPHAYSNSMQSNAYSQQQQRMHAQHPHIHSQAAHHRPALTVSPTLTSELPGTSDSACSISSVSAETTPPPATPPGSSTAPAGANNSLKRVHGYSLSSSTSDLAASSNSEHRPQRPPSKKRRGSSAVSDAAATQSRLSDSGTGASSKGPLLSASQKKANHIQSEQKRRANIRRGYEALCDTVPALRAAIKAEEEAQAALASTMPEGSSPVTQKRNRRRGRKGDETSGFGDRTDGRAGPRSENVVLQKSMSYFKQLNM